MTGASSHGRKFIELQELAALLGISADDISDMRSRGEVYGYRDGSTWKFKIEDVTASCF